MIANEAGDAPAAQRPLRYRSETRRESLPDIHRHRLRDHRRRRAYGLRSFTDSAQGSMTIEDIIRQNADRPIADSIAKIASSLAKHRVFLASY